MFINNNIYIRILHIIIYIIIHQTCTSTEVHHSMFSFGNVCSVKLRLKIVFMASFMTPPTSPTQVPDRILLCHRVRVIYIGVCAFVLHRNSIILILCPLRGIWLIHLIRSYCNWILTRCIEKQRRKTNLTFYVLQPRSYDDGKVIKPLRDADKLRGNIDILAVRMDLNTGEWSFRFCSGEIQ